MDSTDSVSRAVSSVEEWVIDDDCEGFVSVADQAVNEVSRLVLSSPTNGPSPLDEDPEGRLVEIIQRMDPNGTISIKAVSVVGNAFLANPDASKDLLSLAGIAPLGALPPAEHQGLPSAVQVEGQHVISRTEMINNAIPVIQQYFPQASGDTARTTAEGIFDKLFSRGGSGNKTKKTREMAGLALIIGSIVIAVILRYQQGGFSNMSQSMRFALNKVIKFVNGGQ